MRKKLLLMIFSAFIVFVDAADTSANKKEAAEALVYLSSPLDRYLFKYRRYFVTKEGHNTGVFLCALCGIERSVRMSDSNVFQSHFRDKHVKNILSFWEKY